MDSIWKYLITLIIGIVIGFLIGSKNISIKEIPVEVHDTITITTERIVEHTKIINTVDTLVKVDSIILEKDGTYVSLPMEFKCYHDSFITDSSKLSLDVKYHGIEANIDNITYNYDYRSTFKCPVEKKIRPFIGILGGPSLNAGWREVNGISLQIFAGTTINKGWGVIGSYEIDGINNQVSHEVKVGFIKQF